MNQEPKTKVEKMNETREIVADFYQPPPNAGIEDGDAVIPVWRSEKHQIPHLEWVAWPQRSRRMRLIEIMNSRNNILAKIEELKYAAECLEDLVNNWENKTVPFPPED